MTTKRDFEATARVFSEAISGCKTDHAKDVVTWMADQFIARYTAENPRFNRERFLKACGILP